MKTVYGIARFSQRGGGACFADGEAFGGVTTSATGTVTTSATVRAGFSQRSSVGFAGAPRERAGDRVAVLGAHDTQRFGLVASRDAFSPSAPKLKRHGSVTYPQHPRDYDLLRRWANTD